MFQLLFLLSNPAQADIGPPPSCPSGEYRTYLRGHRCVRNGYVLVDLSDFDIPWEIVDKIEDGEVTVPGLDMSDIKIRRGTAEVKEEDEGKVVKLLKEFDATKLETATESKKTDLEKKGEDATEPVKTIEKAELKAVGEVKKEAPVSENSSKDCSNVSASQSLFLVLFAFVFSGFRRRF